MLYISSFSLQYASRVKTKKSKQKLLRDFLSPTFSSWNIKFLPEIVKEFLTYYTAVFILHSPPVLMGLISVSAMITLQLASITGAGSLPEPSHPFLIPSPPITGPLKSIPCSQLNHTLQVSKCFAPTWRQTTIHQLHTQLWIADFFFLFSIFACSVHKLCV